MIPAKWRVGQMIVLAIIALLAVYYATIGWRSAEPGSGAADSKPLFDFVGFAVLAALTWMTTPTVGVIAMATFREALRRRWMTVLLVFGMVMVGLSVFFTSLSPGTEGQFIRDFGTGFIIIMTTLMAIFLGRVAGSARHRAPHNFHDFVETRQSRRVSHRQIFGIVPDAFGQSAFAERHFSCWLTRFSPFAKKVASAPR